MLKKILLVAVFVTSAQADLPFQPKFSWTPPSQFNDTSALDPATDLEGYRLKCTGAKPIDSVLPNNVITWTAPVGMFRAGDYNCVMSSVAIGGAESSDSNPVNFTINAKKPDPVINFGID